MINWDQLKQEHKDINEELTQPNLDKRRRAELQKRNSQLVELLGVHERLTDIESQISVSKQSAEAETDAELQEMFAQEIEELEDQKKTVEAELEEMLIPPDTLEQRSVFLEIRAGAGGQEAALFATDLFRMYTTFALAKHWTVSIVDENLTDIGGYKEVVAHIKGKNVYKYLKYESGVHRVQRVPKTETQGRVHTSTVTVAVLPEAKEVDLTINPSDLRIDTYRAQGAGGQHVNTTDSAVRIVHIPTGVTVQCQDERSQHKNKDKAMKMLRARLVEAERERLAAERSQQRKEQVGTGERSEKIRTYNYPQNRITDHRVNVTLKKLDMVMQGDLLDLLEPLMVWDREQRRAAATG